MFFKFLDLVFSPSGCVGRGVWWRAQLVIVPLIIVLVLGLYHTADRLAMLTSIPRASHDSYLQALPIPERNKEKREMTVVDWNIFLALILVLFLVVWAHFVIEIKRWHDLELSGFFVLLRFVPVFTKVYLGAVAGGIASAVELAITIYLLGFRSGPSDHAQDPPRTRWATLKDASGPIGLVAIAVVLFETGIISPTPGTTVEVRGTSLEFTPPGAGDADSP